MHYSTYNFMFLKCVMNSWHFCLFACLGESSGESTALMYTGFLKLLWAKCCNLRLSLKVYSQHANIREKAGK